MKKSFTLLFAFLISVSLMGQVFIKKGSSFNLLKKSQRETTFEKFMHKKHHGMVFTGPMFHNRKTTGLKFTQIRMQRLDSIIYVQNNTATNEAGKEKDEFFYDTLKNNTLSISYDWIDSTNQWLPFFKDVNKYDSKGNVLQDLIYEWTDSTNQWGNYTKIIFNYDNSGKDTMDMQFWWDTSKRQWYEAIRVEYFYDIQGKLIQMKEFDWDFSTGHWGNPSKTEYIYDSLGNNMQQIVYGTKDSTGNWVASYKYGFTFDNQGNRIQEVDYKWDNSKSQWVNGNSKETFTYDNSYSFDELIFPPLDGGEFITLKHMLTSIIYYDWNKSTNEWQISEQDTLYYSGQNVTGIPQHGAKLNIEVYPNPAADYIIVDMKSSSSPALIELYDMVGRKVISQEIFGKQQISIRKLKSGIYICRITYRGKTQTTEIRKE